MKINKQVIKDYFGSFFGQFKLNKEQFDTVRKLVDEAECGCCYTTMLYWLSVGGSLVANPADQQIVFKDDSNNIILQTALTGTAQRVCIPREAAQICVNIINQTNVGGTVEIIGANVSVTTADEVGESCFALTLPVSPFFIVSPVPAP